MVVQLGIADADMNNFYMFFNFFLIFSFNFLSFFFVFLSTASVVASGGRRPLSDLGEELRALA